ncbi:secreted chorismate mutase [Mycobacterium mantenii]|uniref:Chorismate mutase n=1 Tax=Mycobacterium mantenii TaxID=560555 RepID=A0A1X0F5J0_MYCNT|nr:chorismate mutase [Mycobacterium mantenii]MCV7245328.1 chorismate mutase [Mycobacterium mantenii]ORA97086.1 chorismate mutase [Mycobacterium mantenii]BBY37114.1 secreted chorismate mutase [Mycobacterium mantenii]
MHRKVHLPRPAVAVRCGVLIGSLAMLVAPARADTASPLTPLVDAAAQRLQIAEPVAAYKWNTHGAIEDPARVQQELTRLGDDAVAEHIDRDYVTRVFGDQIAATEAIEYSRFAGWKLNRASAPADSPDLSASRSAIDALNQMMLTQILADWDLLHSPECAAQLQAATGSVIQGRQLDNLYQQALSSATQSYCQR